MTVFPFIAIPALDATGIIKSREMEVLLKERIRLVPLWVKAMLNVK
jgi:hypothetical protein